MANTSFYDPKDIGLFDIATTQLNKPMVLTTTAGVFSTAPKLVFFTVQGIIVQEYTVGSGIVRAGDGLTLTINFNGSDFVDAEGATLNAEMSLFNDGDPDIIFQLLIIKSRL